MPELPEVQTIVSDLNKKIIGDKISGFWSDWPKAIRNVPVKKFEKEIKDRKILGAKRIGKNIFLDLSGGKTIYIHLKMTGHLLVKSKTAKDEARKYFNEKVNQYIHHIFFLGKNKTLEFSDLRKFGKIILADTKEINELKEIKALGIDAMSPEFTEAFFNNLLTKKQNKKIRDILMDQNLISGIGNIYASEILFKAGIMPTRTAKNIDLKEGKELYTSIKKVFKKALKMRGTSESDYRDTAGAPGSFQKALKVYHREGQKCRTCDTIIKRIKMGQRSAFYCSRCQK